MALRPLNEVVEYLERKHAEDQESIASALALNLYPLWWIMDFEDLDKTSMLFTEAAMPTVRTAYLQSQHVAAAFAANVRFASLPTAEPMPMSVAPVEIPSGVDALRFDLPELGNAADPISFDDFPEADARVSLLVESNFNIKKQMPVLDPTLTMQAAQVNSTGAAVRQSLKGARNVTANVVKLDKRVLGYARYTDGNPCHFCALLASRGAVYSRESFAESDSGFVSNGSAVEVPSDYVRVSKVHNNCRCTLRPVYSKSQEYDTEARFYRSQWKKVWDEHGHKSPDEVVQAWRESYKPYQRNPLNITNIQNALQERESSLLAEGFEADSPQVRWAQRTQSLLA